jgi:thiol-disulfide isomerase/thioredoxin
MSLPIGSMRSVLPTLVGATIAGAALAALGLVLYITNRAPVVPAVDPLDATTASRPYVVKMHAQWCAICLSTKGMWSKVEQTYAGRVNLVVFDVTSDATTDVSRREARRIGLESAFDDYSGVTGIVLVLNGGTKQVTAEIDGSRDFAEYRAAIDAALVAGGSR